MENDEPDGLWDVPPASAFLEVLYGDWEWWSLLIISAGGRLRQEDCHKYEASLGYGVKPGP